MNTQKVYTTEWKLAEGKTCAVNYIINQMSDDLETLGADLSTESDISKVSVGDVVVIYSRGKYRTAIVNNVGRKNVKAGYATVGGIEDARKRLAWQNEDPSHMNYGRKLVQDGGDMHATVTNKSTDRFWALEQTVETETVETETVETETVETETAAEIGSFSVSSDGVMTFKKETVSHDVNAGWKEAINQLSDRIKELEKENQELRTNCRLFH